MNGGCPICSHAERPFLDRLLLRGRSPRSVARGVNGANRKQLARHRDVCLEETVVSVGATEGVEEVAGGAG